MKKIITILSIVTIIILVIAVIYFVFNKSQEIKFSGVVVPGGRNGCYVDGACSIMVGNYEVITNPGDIEEKHFGTIDLGIQVGDNVKVYGKKLNETTIILHGKESYYLKKNIIEK